MNRCSMLTPTTMALLCLGAALSAGDVLSQTAKDAMVQETFVGTYGETRTLLAFKVRDAALQSVLPDGWQPNPFSAGPSKDANLSVSFVEQLVVQNSEGKAGDTLRLLPLSIPVKRKGTEMTGPTTMVFHAFASHASYIPGPYGVHMLGKLNMERTVRTDPVGHSKVEESWELSADNGDHIQLQLQYLRGVPAKGKTEVRVHSAIRPDFYRIYRIEQATDVVRSAATGTDRVQKFFFKASGQKLSQLFDGSEQLISISSLPWYTRQVFLPKLSSQ